MVITKFLLVVLKISMCITITLFWLSQKVMSLKSFAHPFVLVIVIDIASLNCLYFSAEFFSHLFSVLLRGRGCFGLENLFTAYFEVIFFLQDSLF